MKKCLILIFILLYPSAHAHPWGPVTHTYLAAAGEDSLPDDSGLKEFLFAYEEDYIYGCVAPDIYVSQYFDDEGYRKHKELHSWDTAFLLLKLADTDDEKAFAVGYFVHLISDSVAHNRYVPKQGVALGMTMKESHAVIESSVDDQMDPRYRTLLDTYLQLRSDADIALLQRVVKDPSLKEAEYDFRLQANIYSRSKMSQNSTLYQVSQIIGSNYEPYHNETIETVAEFFRVLDEKEPKDYYGQALKAERLGIIGQEDPTGEEAQRLADEQVGSWWSRLNAKVSLWWTNFVFKH